MADMIPGYTTEQKVVTVPNPYDDTGINAAITAEAPDQWLVSSLFETSAGMVILFTRTIAVTPGT